MPVVSPDTAAEGDIDFASLEQTNLVPGAQIIVSPEFIAADLVSQEPTRCSGCSPRGAARRVRAPVT
jgi:hypothetical protein